MKRSTVLLVTLGLILIISTGCGSSSSNDSSSANGIISSTEDGAYNPAIDPADFTSSTEIDNQYFPLVPGTIFIYEGEDDEGVIEKIIVEVTGQTKLVMGVACVVVRDTVSEVEDGEEEVVEDTYDWFAQDNDGNVWYFGEDSWEYEDGEVASNEGSWEAGVDGALPGIIMHADPQVGVPYQQEYYEGEAEDMAEVISLNETVTVPFGTFENCLQTKEWTPLEPGIVEHKFYAPGIGFIKEIKVEGEEGYAELTDIE